MRSARILELLGWSTLAEMCLQHKVIMMYKIVHGLAPPYMTDMFREQLDPKVYDLRNSKLNLEIPAARTSRFKNSFAFTGASIWNALPDDLKQLPSVSGFKKKIKTFGLHRQQQLCNLYIKQLAFILLTYTLTILCMPHSF